MRAKRRHRQHHRVLGRDPVHRVLLFALVICGGLALYYTWCGFLASRYLAPSAQNTDYTTATGFFLALLVILGISLVRTVDEPAGLHRIRSSKRWRRVMRR